MLAGLPRHTEIAIPAERSGRLMSFALRIALLILALLGAGAAAAQDGSLSGGLLSPGFVAPNPEVQLAPPAEMLAPPQLNVPAPLPTATLAPGRRHRLVLQARLVDDGEPLTAGIIWRVFTAQPDATGALPLVLEAEPGGTTTVQLPSGDYFVHAAFGRAGATKRITVGNDDQTESLVLNAGGLRLDAIVGEGRQVPADRLTFDVLQENENGDLITVVPGASAGTVIRLSAGTYHVVSRYGNVNAVVRADIEVEAGSLTEAVMRHTGAEVTLKLVSTEGGEALANTSWTVTTQDGITVHESIGAFPSIVLAAGSYTAIARHQDEIYSRDFSVEAGIERDIEVQLSDLVQPETGVLVDPSEAATPRQPQGTVLPPVEQ